MPELMNKHHTRKINKKSDKRTRVVIGKDIYLIIDVKILKDIKELLKMGAEKILVLGDEKIKDEDEKEFYSPNEVFAELNAKYSKPGAILQGARAKESLTQKELAAMLGIAQHHVSEMEHGKRPIGKDMAHRLADVLKVNYKIFL